MGCKDENGILHLSCNESFTLTMWDVKSSTSNSFGQSFAFYLNYVGCKVNLSCLFLSLFVCFTLTMWDVKILFKSSNDFIPIVLP